MLDIVGIWEYAKHIYVLRKHPGIAMLKKEEKEPGDVDEDESWDQEAALWIIDIIGNL